MNEANGGLPTASQRAMYAADSVSKREMGIPQAAEFFEIGKSSIERALAIKTRSVDVASEVRTGKITLTHALRKVGYSVKRQPRVNHGDRWDDAIPLATKYAQHWAGKGYTKINPKEAARRLKLLRELQEALLLLESDLEQRSASATLRLRR